MLALLNAYFTYDRNPIVAVRNLAENRHFGAALWGYAIAAMCWVSFFWIGDGLSLPGLLWRLAFFFLLEVTLGYVWAALSGLFLNFFSNGNGPSALFIVIGVSGLMQGLALAFALIAAAGPWLRPLLPLLLLLTLLMRFLFVLRNIARAASVTLPKALLALVFALVPLLASVVLCAGFAVLLLVFVF